MIPTALSRGRPQSVFGTVIGGIAAALIVLKVGEPVRAVAGGLLLLVLPGYVWTVPFRSGDWGRRARAALVPTISVGQAIVLGLILNLFAGGLTAGHWALGLEATTCAGMVAGFLLPGRSESESEAEADPHRIGPRALLYRSVQVGVLAAMVGVAAWLSLASQHHLNAEERFTVLAVDRTSATGPTVRVMNHQERSETYTLAAATADRTVARVPLTLKSNQTRIVRLAVPAPSASTSSSVRLTITLSRTRDGTPLREVWLHAHDEQWR